METSEYFYTAEVKYKQPFGPPIPEWEVAVSNYDTLKELEFNLKHHIEIMKDIREIDKYRIITYKKDNIGEEIKVCGY